MRLRARERRDPSLRVRSVALVNRDEAQHERHDEPGRDSGDQQSEAAICARLAVDTLRFSMTLLVADLSTRVEELAFEVRQSLGAVVDDVDDMLETRAAIERAGVAVENDPARGRLA